jgi:prepilin-type N-terminal cleavage/methylation domain-containing protein
MHKKARGFTIIEVISVLLILGIVSAVVVSRIDNLDSYDLSSQVEVVKNHLRYAQSRAMGSANPWGIHFDSATTYYLFQGENPTTQISLPGENSSLVDLAGKNSKLIITPPNPDRITFDEFGSPGTNTITISTNGGNIVITRYTGFIP